MGSTRQEMYRKTDFYQVKSRQLFINFHILAKLFETCIMGANDELNGKTTHYFYWFLHTNDKGLSYFNL